MEKEKKQLQSTGAEYSLSEKASPEQQGSEWGPESGDRGSDGKMAERRPERVRRRLAPEGEGQSKSGPLPEEGKPTGKRHTGP